MNQNAAFSRVILSAALLLLVVGAGCDDAVDLCDPPVPSGRIQGRVFSGGLPVEARVTAEMLLDSWPFKALYMTEVDENGNYSLDVAPGSYEVDLKITSGSARYYYSESGLTYDGRTGRDTLVIKADAPPVEIDFELGGVVLDMNVPFQLNGYRAEVVLHREGEPDDNSGLTYMELGQGEINFSHLHVAIGGVLPGRYQAVIVLGDVSPWDDGNYNYDHFWVPGTRDRSESPWFEVTADGLVNLEAEITEAPGRIEGRIGGAWQDMGLRDYPRLSMVGLDSVPVFQNQKTQPDGSFAIDVFLPEPVKLMVHQGGIDQWVGGASFEEATVHPLESGQTIADIEFLQSGIHLYVDAPLEATGTALVKFMDPVSLELVAEDHHSLRDHHLGIANLRPGNFLIRITYDEWNVGGTRWLSQWYDRAATADQAGVITIDGPGTTTSAHLTIELGGGIRGAVEFQGDPSYYYYIVVTPADELSAWGERSRSVWFESTYSFVGLPDGDYRIGVLPEGSGEVVPVPEGVTWYPGTADWASAGVLEIRNAEVLENVDIVVPAPE